MRNRKWYSKTLAYVLSASMAVTCIPMNILTALAEEVVIVDVADQVEEEVSAESHAANAGTAGQDDLPALSDIFEVSAGETVLDVDNPDNADLIVVDEDYILDGETETESETEADIEIIDVVPLIDDQDADADLENIADAIGEEEILETETQETEILETEISVIDIPIIEEETHETKISLIETETEKTEDSDAVISDAETEETEEQTSGFAFDESDDNAVSEIETEVFGEISENGGEVLLLDSDSDLLQGETEKVFFAEQSETALTLSSSEAASLKQSFTGCIQQIREGLKNRQETITFSAYADVDEDTLGDLAYYFIDWACEHTGVPTEGDYIGYQLTYWSVYYSWCDTTHYVTWEYSVDYSTTSAQEQQVDSKVAQVINSLGLSGMTDFEKTKAIYRWVCGNVSYSLDGAHTTAYNALILGHCGCQGYACLMYRLLCEAGVDCRIVSGFGGDYSEFDGSPNHCWNIVHLNGIYYLLDATWDNGSTSDWYWFLHGSSDWEDHYETDGTSQVYSISTDNYLKKQEVSGTTEYSKTYGDASFNLNVKSTGDGALQYESSDTSVAEVNGNGVVTVKGVGAANISVHAAESNQFTKSNTLTVSITVSECTLDRLMSYVASGSEIYNGKSYKDDILSDLNIKCKCANKHSLGINQDYTVSFKNKTTGTKDDTTNAGVIEVTVTGKNDHTGTLTGSITINQQALKAANVSLSLSSYTYDGTAKQPAVTVKSIYGKQLKQGTDYTVKYSNNTNVGTATVTVTGKGNYSGTINKTFTITEALPVCSVKGHTVVKDKKVAATCTMTGKTEGSHCSVCGTVLTEQKTVPATGHISVTDKAVAATCTMTGKTEGSHCSVCGTVLTAQKTISATGHTVVKDAAVAATCTTAGKTEGSHCSVCGTVLTAQKTVPATGHKTVTDKAVAATCTTAGKTEGSHCSVCGKVITAQKEIPATGHTVVKDKKVAATVFKAGKTEGSHCSVCGKVLTAQKKVAKLTPTIKLSAAKKTIKVKKSFTLTISKLANGDSVKSVKSASTKIAKVKKLSNKRYKITGVKKGKVKITVTLKSGKKATCTVTVKK